jgi:hypothetical protein
MTSDTLLEQHPEPAPLQPTGPFLDLDHNVFVPSFNARACSVRHRLTDHPLLGMPELLKLAKRLPPKYVRINTGHAPVNATPSEIPGTTLSVEEGFERIGENDTRIMLKGIEHDGPYRDLLYSCIGELEALNTPVTRNITEREGYVFISAPNMITPYHMDPEINFLLQIRGRKTFFVLPGYDRSILSEEDIELFYAGLHKSLPFREEWRDKAVPFHLDPGDGVHIPVNHPHWVQTYDDVSISFAVTLQTSATHRRGIVYALNEKLRRRGLRPVPFGRSPVRDFLKHQGYRLWDVVSRAMPGRKRPSDSHHY